jgi:prepilin-type N-terminal cleavage/methylation domain-containing protein
MTAHATGMTLVEIMIALAIASLMTLTGWRAVDALQVARDRVIAEAAQWQRLDDLFVTLEADLRRASISEFSGSGEGLFMLQPALDGGPDVQTVRYQFAAVALVDGSAGTQILRTVGSTTTPMADVRSVAVAYSQDGATFDFGATAYPRALRFSVQPLAAVGPVERLLALR